MNILECVCGECLTDSFVPWGSFVTRRSWPAAAWASQSDSINAWARSFIALKTIQSSASCWRTTTVIQMKDLSEGAVWFTHVQGRRILGPETLLVLQSGGALVMGTLPPQPAGFWGGKDSMLCRMLSTEFLFPEQIHSFWMTFTKQNASGWVPTQNKFCN